MVNDPFKLFQYPWNSSQICAIVLLWWLKWMEIQTMNKNTVWNVSKCKPGFMVLRSFWSFIDSISSPWARSKPFYSKPCYFIITLIPMISGTNYKPLYQFHSVSRKITSHHQGVTLPPDRLWVRSMLSQLQRTVSQCVQVSNVILSPPAAEICIVPSYDQPRGQLYHTLYERKYSYCSSRINAGTMTSLNPIHCKTTKDNILSLLSTWCHWLSAYCTPPSPLLPPTPQVHAKSIQY